MELSVAAGKAARWARGESLVLRVYFFGSRVKGRYRPESDLDVAIEIDRRQLAPDTEAALVACWFAHQGRWRKDLQGRLCLRIDLDWHRPRRSNAVAHGVVEAGRLVYEKGVPPAGKDDACSTT